MAKLKKSKISIIVLILSIMAMVTSFFHSLKDDFIEKVETEFVKKPLQQEENLTMVDIEHLPRNVQKYIVLTGAVGKPKIQNLRLEFDAEMFSKPGAKPMISDVVQYSFFGSYSRVFFLKTSMFMIPTQVLHAYIGSSASMVVRIASLFSIVHLSGPELTSTETVTVLNDLCVFAPSAMTDRRLTWREIDSLRTEVTFLNNQFTVKALLIFNERGELVDFESDDRPDVTGKPGRQRVKWSTPLRDYKETGGMFLTSVGEAVYHLPEGNFSYGTFRLRKIEFNLKEFRDK
jgi:hypothetical protein